VVSVEEIATSCPAYFFNHDTAAFGGGWFGCLSRQLFRRRFFDVVDEIDRHREDDGGVFLGRYLVERLKISQLESRLGLIDDVCGRFESFRCLLLPLRRYHLSQYSDVTASTVTDHDWKSLGFWERNSLFVL